MAFRPEPLQTDGEILSELEVKFQLDRHAQAVRTTIAKLPLEELHRVFRGSGSLPYQPELMLAIAFFEILRSDTSPARWHQDASTRDQCRLGSSGKKVSGIKSLPR